MAASESWVRNKIAAEPELGEIWYPCQFAALRQSRLCAGIDNLRHCCARMLFFCACEGHKITKT
jgi:hypothetical protein